LVKSKDKKIQVLKYKSKNISIRVHWSIKRKREIK
jgi:hypothetical protein